MPRKQKNIHYLYKTTCLVTGRYYIGMHSTNNLEDGYMGSGKRLRYSIRKYGKENHVKEILEFFDSRELLIEAEKKMITPDMLVDTMCMNIGTGGIGGFLNENHKEKFQKAGSIAGIQALRKKMLIDLDFKNKVVSTLRQNVINGHKLGKYDYATFKGKKHSAETKEKMSQVKKDGGRGDKNSQYGTMWITNGTQNRKIKKEDIIPAGWYKGRKFFND